MYDHDVQNVFPAQGQSAEPPTPLHKKHIGFAIGEAVLLFVCALSWIMGSLFLWLFKDKEYILSGIVMYDSVTNVSSGKRNNLDPYYLQIYLHSEQIFKRALIALIVSIVILLIVVFIKGKKRLFGNVAWFLISSILLFFAFLSGGGACIFASDFIRVYRSDRDIMSLMGISTLTDKALADFENQTSVLIIAGVILISVMAILSLIAAIVFRNKKKKEDVKQWNHAVNVLKTNYDAQYHQYATQLQNSCENAIGISDEVKTLPYALPRIPEVPAESRLSFRLFIFSWMMIGCGGLLYFCSEMMNASISLGRAGAILMLFALLLLLTALIISIVQKVKESHDWAILENEFRSAGGLLMQEYMQRVFAMQVAAAPVQSTVNQPQSTSTTQHPVPVPTVSTVPQPDLSTPAQSATFCSACGKSVKSGAKFCQHCVAPQR